MFCMCSGSPIGAVYMSSLLSLLQYLQSLVLLGAFLLREGPSFPASSIVQWPVHSGYVIWIANSMGSRACSV